MSDWTFQGDQIVYHHTMPKRWDKRDSISADHLRRKLNGHPADATVSGRLQIENAPVWIVKTTGDNTIAAVRDHLKREGKGRRVVQLNLDVIVDLKKQERKARLGIDAKAPLTGASA